MAGGGERSPEKLLGGNVIKVGLEGHMGFGTGEQQQEGPGRQENVSWVAALWGRRLEDQGEPSLRGRWGIWDGRGGPCMWHHY